MAIMPRMTRAGVGVMLVGVLVSVSAVPMVGAMLLHRGMTSAVGRGVIFVRRDMPPVCQSFDFTCLGILLVFGHIARVVRGFHVRKLP